MINRRSLFGFLAAAPVVGAALLKLGPLVEAGSLVRTGGVGMAGALDGVRGGFIIGEAGPEMILPAEIFTIHIDGNLVTSGSIVGTKEQTI